MSDFPSFSIIIPTYQRPFELVRCLKAIQNLNYPKEKFEVIVVDDGSGLEEKLLSHFRTNLNLILLHQENFGPATARNHGARLAKNDYLAFTDDDCEPDADWLIKFAEQIKASPKHLLGGKITNALESNIYSTASQMLVSYFHKYSEQFNPNFAFFTTNNMVLLRSKFLSLGGFDESFIRAAAEDRDFSSRWQESNHKMFFLESAIVRHSHNLSWKSFLRQHFDYGRGACHFYTLRKIRRKQRIKIEPLSFYTGMFYFPFLSNSIFRASQISLLFFIVQCANSCCYLREYISILKLPIQRKKQQED
jgi:glycosyltransferase involved in cell wall biosynthesis